MTIRMKATERHVPVVQFILLYKVVLTFESVEMFESVKLISLIESF